MDWLREIEERCAKATPGPWEVERRDYDNMYDTRPDRSRVVLERDRDGLWKDTTGAILSQDAAFIASARTDIPRLLEVVRAADALAKALDDFGLQSGDDMSDVFDALEAYQKARRGE